MTTIARVHQEKLTGLSIAGQGFLALVVDMYWESSGILGGNWFTRTQTELVIRMTSISTRFLHFIV